MAAIISLHVRQIERVWHNCMNLKSVIRLIDNERVIYSHVQLENNLRFVTYLKSALFLASVAALVNIKIGNN